VTEKLFRTFTAASGVERIPCPSCLLDAVKIFSTPFPGHFFGSPEGYSKPSPMNRWSTKLAAYKGNEHSLG
jgi:hypothetical protein